MTLKMQTDYALRTLIYLAHANGQASVQEIATAYGISKDHLFKVVQQLVRLGYVMSRPGRNGGIRLAFDAERMNCGEVVAAFEGRRGLLPCVKDQSYCLLEPGCVLRTALIAAEESMYHVLERLSIADVIAANRRDGHGGVYNLTVRGRRAVTPGAQTTGADAPLDADRDGSVAPVDAADPLNDTDIDPDPDAAPGAEGSVPP
jgi:Rrf2 family transcriptional regulator, nitric oxide-sensitive transcriptional repressor